MKTIWILGDQLSLAHGALAATPPDDAVILLIESKARGSHLRYHKLKLVLIYSAMRHFARDLEARGWRVDYHLLPDTPTLEAGLRRHVKKFSPNELWMAAPNSFAETEAVTTLADKLCLPLRTFPSPLFLQDREDFRAWAGGSRRLLMENHYRRMRKRFGFLMQANGQPVGGAWNFDRENRATLAEWKRAGRPRPRTEPREKPDAITREVMAMVEREFPESPGAAADFWLPVERKGALRWLRRFVREGLPEFGRFEDLMATGEPTLFHSVLSPLLNIGLLHPRECVEAAIAASDDGAAPLNSVEGYVRQMIGWREFINGIYWLRGPEYATLNSLGAERPLPVWAYTAETSLNCLHQVVHQTLTLGWNHHIQRLMVLGNFFLISGVQPQAALRWFLEMYVDAFDWVMAANVIGMALHADGGFMATKPYAATSTYINKMSDYCADCRFKPARKTGPDACPFNYLYWHFIDQHAEAFGKNPRMRMIVSSWRKRSEASRDEVRAAAEQFLENDGIPKGDCDR